ncbi:multiple coagulation factor deficiency protein 2 homolog [Colletes gigas]|uniref:multiple coagulation factor deficiency protein 2 homolog n=1 Tax=Colletes gigas TaxID=935657 RepID=UPI001C9A467F|nr:multiple coagulation factor deficiency protein 2 homolog [Colletes gigas]XP_043251205.1 multiple coagulation factor deficiency protein 2 homolog [Colletes gigas]
MNWTLWLFIIGSFCCKYIHAQMQRVPPGVSPQHYQQPVQQVHHASQQIPQQQFQQVPGQVPMHHVPVQQVPVQQHMPTHQVPVQQGYGHEHPQQILDHNKIVNEKAHIAEHMEVPIDISKMTEQELQFHYFKMHDADNNNKLDGCELIKSLMHWHEQGNKEAGEGNTRKNLFKDEELVILIDPILSVDDTNNDGYINYPEFIKAQQNAGVGTGGRQ